MRINYFLILFILSINTYAQEKGKIIGLNLFFDNVQHQYIYFNGLQKEILQSKGAYSIEPFIELEFLDKLSLKSGLNFSARGFRKENLDFTGYYLQLPLHVKTSIYVTDYVELNPYGGVYAGFPIGGDNQELKDNSIRVSESKFDFGLEGGAALTYPFPNGGYSISVVFRAQYGLTNVYNLYDYEKRRNVVFSIGIGFAKRLQE